MRGVLVLAAVFGVLTSGAATFADEPPPSVAHPLGRQSSPYRSAPVDSEQAVAHGAYAPGPEAYQAIPHAVPEYASHSHGYVTGQHGRRPRGSARQRFHAWLTYRALPVPRECKHMRSCVGCIPPLYAYFAFRYPAAGCGYGHGHDAPFVAAPPPFGVPPGH